MLGEARPRCRTWKLLPKVNAREEKKTMMTIAILIQEGNQKY